MDITIDLLTLVVKCRCSHTVLFGVDSDRLVACNCIIALPGDVINRRLICLGHLVFILCVLSQCVKCMTLNCVQFFCPHFHCHW